MGMLMDLLLTDKKIKIKKLQKYINRSNMNHWVQNLPIFYLVVHQLQSSLFNF